MQEIQNSQNDLERKDPSWNFKTYDQGQTYRLTE